MPPRRRRRAAGIAPTYPSRPTPPRPTRLTGAVAPTDERDTQVREPIGAHQKNNWRTGALWLVPVLFIAFVWTFGESIADFFAYLPAYEAKGCKSGTEMTESLKANCKNAGKNAAREVYGFWKFLSLPIGLYIYFLLRTRVTRFTKRPHWSRLAFNLFWIYVPEDKRQKMVDKYNAKERRREDRYNSLTEKERRPRVPIVMHVIGLIAIALVVVSVFATDVWTTVFIVAGVILLAVIAIVINRRAGAKMAALVVFLILALAAVIVTIVLIYFP